MSGIATTQVQDLELCFVKPCEPHTSLPFKPVKVPMDDVPSLQHVDSTSHLGVNGKFAEGVRPIFRLRRWATTEKTSSLLKIFPETF